jgi:hypothetical protein
MDQNSHLSYIEAYFVRFRYPYHVMGIKIKEKHTETIITHGPLLQMEIVDYDYFTYRNLVRKICSIYIKSLRY